MRIASLLATIVVTSTLLAAHSQAAHADWPHDPYNGNVPVCTANNIQQSQVILADGAGGAFVAWEDLRSGWMNVYVQRLSASGEAMWTADGVALWATSTDQGSPALAPDGAGGVIVAWRDMRNGTDDIFAQRLNAAGVAQWAFKGINVCTATNGQGYPQAVSDGAGGAIITWVDYRNSSVADIYAQRVSGAGSTLWAANGVALCTAAGAQAAPVIATDGAGGAIVAWLDPRSGASDIYAQRVSALGAALWTGNGVAVCTSANTQDALGITADGAGGAILSWEDARSATNYDIYAQRLSAAGNPLWAANGAGVSVAAGNQLYPVIATDGAGGAILAWTDARGADPDIYAQRMSAAGAPLWTANGIAVCALTNNQDSPAIVTDGAGGAIVAWHDFRASNFDVYAQRVGPTGGLLWLSSGVGISLANGYQTSPVIAADGSGGAILAWQDSRTESDLYAQRIEHYGQLGNPEPAIVAVKDVPGDQGGALKVSWSASWLDADPVYGVSEYRIFRSAAPAAPGAAARRAVTFDSDEAVATGALLAQPAATGTVYWEYVATQAAEAFAGYSHVIATASDSVGAGNPRTQVMIEARASTGTSAARWASAPDSGYSVDNLPPAAPVAFAGNFTRTLTTLTWNANTEPDLAGYRLYAGASPGFVPGPSNLVASPTQANAAFGAAAPAYWKLSAVDSHGNESAFVTLLPAGVAGVGDGPRALAFAPVTPVPSRGAVRLAFTLPSAQAATLVIHDAQGRLVRTLLDGPQAAGEFALSWDGADANGRQAPNGLYFARLTTAGRTLVRRLVTVR